MEGKVERPMRSELTYPCKEKKKKKVTKLKLTKKISFVHWIPSHRLQTYIVKNAIRVMRRNVISLKFLTKMHHL